MALATGPSDRMNAAAAAASQKPASDRGWPRRKTRARRERPVTTSRAASAMLALRQRSLTRRGIGPSEEKPCPVRITTDSTP